MNKSTRHTSRHKRSSRGGLGSYARDSARDNEANRAVPPKPRILKAGYPVPISLPEVDECEAKLPSMDDYNLAALADALIKRRPLCEDPALKCGYTRILQAIRRIAISAGPATVAAIGHDLYFKWPSTVYHGLGTALSVDWTKDGPLKFFGYCVGVSSPLSSNQRRAILAQVFAAQFPTLVPQHIRESWGPPRSPQRLSKMAHAIAYQARNAKGRTNADLEEAIDAWESDLEFLRRKYYAGTFGFG